MARKVYRSWRQAKIIHAPVVFQLLRYEALQSDSCFDSSGLLRFDDTGGWQPVGHGIRL